MNCLSHAVGLSLVALLALVPEAAFCQSKPAPALELKFPASSGKVAPASLARTRPLNAASGVRRGPRFQQFEPSLSERALQNLVDNAELESLATANEDEAMFRFERRGSAGRDLSQGYKSICKSAAEKLWDEPNGKRVKFDSAGKPGVAIEIPLR